ncbi:hypothetical protein D3C73_1576790 [compost metagenome]
MLGRVALFLDFLGELAGLFECRAIQCRIDAHHMIQPCFEIDTAVRIDRLVHSHLYHLCFTFPYSAPLGALAITVRLPVHGNRTKGPAC